MTFKKATFSRLFCFLSKILADDLTIGDFPYKIRSLFPIQYKGSP
ncbi:hypothetical protein VRK_41190 [Vibrio sp. MEBiC08052]|nr:hypothetical protein VRK_41190 [Vibrio sp. MEBiC08052]